MSNSRTDKLLRVINKEFKGSEVLGTITKASKLDDEILVIPTASLKLNLITGIGGIPRGYITEIYGLEHSGKSTTLIESIANAQKMGLTVIYVDVEHRFYKKYAKQLGVDLENLIIIHPETAEQGLDLLTKIIELGSAQYYIVDSVAALLPAVENEGAMGNSNMGVRAKLVSQFIRKVTHYLYIHKSALVMVNRPKETIGKFYGPQEYTSGGRDLKNAASIRIEVKKGQVKYTDSTKKEPYSQEMKFTIKKNTFGKPYKKTIANLIMGKGIDQLTEVIDGAIHFGFITQKGSQYYIGEDSFKGKEKLTAYLVEQPDKIEELKKEIYQTLKGE